MRVYYETLSALLQRTIRTFSDIGEDPRLYEKVASYTNVDIITTIVYRGSAKPHMIGYDAFVAYAARPRFSPAVPSTKTYLSGKLTLFETKYFPRMFAGSMKRMTRPHRRRFVTFAYICKRRGLNRDMRKLLSTFLLNLEVDKVVMRHYQPYKRMPMSIDDRYYLESQALLDMYIREYDFQHAFITLLWTRFRVTGKRPFVQSHYARDDILLFGDYFIYLFERYPASCLRNLKSSHRLYEIFGKSHPELCARITQKWNM